MSDVVIKVEGVSKRYKLGKREQYRALRDSLTDMLYAPVRLARSALRGERQQASQDDSQLWALKDVSFEVRRGEVLGIIGRNGAGKSTLLKILSRITKPSRGSVALRGRVAALLEVGTGFHPELTGRENVLLNGSILGMPRIETARKFDEIVAFAEVERFIDTPVKHYSSGMYMRLAFAVAAHLEPDILVVDEVLAVGDSAFQKKCLGRMGEVSNEGRTVLFVSHQMNQIRRLTDRVLWLEAGQVQSVGTTSQVVSQYEVALSSAGTDAIRDLPSDHVAARFLRWELLHAEGEPAHTLSSLGPVQVGFTLKVNQPLADASFGVALYSNDSELIWAHAANELHLAPGVAQLEFALPTLPIRPGVYRWLVSLSLPGREIDQWSCVPELIVATMPMTHQMDAWQGMLNLPWTFEVRNDS